MLTSWLIFPVLMVVALVGCGLLVRGLVGVAIPAALLPGAGLAAMICAGALTTATGATAELTTPVVAALAVAGYVSAWPFDWRAAAREAAVPAAAGAAVFVAFGAPILLSGEPTLAGYIKLDDTATWLALTDRVMEHGRSLDGLAPSTYDATLGFNLGDGYPVGAFIPLGVGSQLVGADPAWIVQPLMSLVAGVLAAALTEIARPLVRSGALRAAVALVAAQSALLVGYVLWGGIKEIEAAALIAVSAGLAPLAMDRGRGPASIVPLALSVAALLSVLSPAGAVWLVPIVAVPPLVLWRRSARAAIVSAATLAGVGLLFLLPLLSGGKLLPPTSSPLTSATAKGNLIEPLSAFQVFGIWPAGDFRLHPDEGLITAVAIAVVVALAIVGIARATRQRAPALLLYVGGAVLGALVLVVAGSPWVDGKALATASPALLFAAALGAAVLFEGGYRLEAALAGVILAGGVLASNLLGYREVNLAPYDQLAELERIGGEVAGEGPALMTEYNPFGARHFLREADAEGASELRRRSIPLRNGEELEKGLNADTDELDLGALMTYRTLVLRRSPGQSRPPAPYRLVRRGGFYDVWQRPADAAELVSAHLPLGTEVDPAGVPDCGEVMRLAAGAGPDDVLAAVPGDPVAVLPLDRTRHPPEWASPAGSAFLDPRTGGELSGDFDWPARTGPVEVWLGGSVRGRIEASLNGERTGEARHQLNNFGQYLYLGQGEAVTGSNSIELRYVGADLHPGSAGGGFPIGPLVFTPLPESHDISLFTPNNAAALCGARWDWIEVLPGAAA